MLFSRLIEYIFMMNSYIPEGYGQDQLQHSPYPQLKAMNPQMITN